tara:strand:+ start:1479 stop:1844 length:366 start_codon:yes stop_codon:yes gene_type:complete
MSSTVYGVGLRNVGSYQVAGRPFCVTGSLDEGTQTITFPNVTKEIIVLNLSGSNELSAYFASASPDGNKFAISGGEQQTFSLKCKEIYLSASSGTDYTLYASLTQIPTGSMYTLTGVGITE